MPQAGVGGSTPSRLAYNVYKQGRWVVHITEPGSLAVAVELEHLLLWDMRDLDGDGKAEWVLSPTEAYLPKFRTQVARWDEGTRALVRTPACKQETSVSRCTSFSSRDGVFQGTVQELKGVPHLLEPEFRLPGHSRSDTSVGTVLRSTGAPKPAGGGRSLMSYSRTWPMRVSESGTPPASTMSPESVVA